MKKSIKSVSVILAVITALCALCACTPKEEQIQQQTKPMYTTLNMDGVGEKIGTVVANNQSEYSIVVSQTASQTVLLAARELQYYLEKCTGVLLPVVTDDTVTFSEDITVFSIGKTSVLEALCSVAQSGFATIDYTKLNVNGFVAKTYNKIVVINGADDSGTLFGAYDWLEKFCGVRFLAGNSFVHTPQTDTVDLYKLDVFSAPAFAYREYYGPSGNNASLYDRTTQNATYTDVLPWCEVEGYNAIHNTLLHVPTNIYYTGELKQQNYHMYTRASETAVPDTPKEICWTDGINEDGTLDESLEVSAVKAVINAIKNFAMQDKDAVFFMIGQEDQGTTCKCDMCKAMEEKYTRGGIAIRFCNVVAREIKKWADEELGGRDIRIVTFAYMYSDTPPVNQNADGKFIPIDETVRCDDNVYIRLAPIDSASIFPINDLRQNPRYHNWTEKWAAVCNHFLVWAYTANFSNSYGYWPVMQSFTKDLQTYRDMGVELMMYQDQHQMPNCWQLFMRRYVASKLMWDPDLDMLAIRDEWLQLFFGEAAYPFVKMLIDDVEEFYAEKMEQGISIYDTNIFSYQVWSAPQLKKHLSWLNSAIDAINKQNIDTEIAQQYITHVEMVKTSPLCMLLTNYDAYYLNDKAGKTEIAKEFFRINDTLGIKNSGMDGILSQIRIELGV